MISVVIPTWNEAMELPATLEALAGNAVPHEIIVADAASTDGTDRIARQAGARVLASPLRRRFAQMNLGAGQARGEVLMFLHADTRLRADSLTAIERALTSPTVVGGAFARRFDHPSPVLKAVCILADWRGRALGWFFGDQAIFSRRDVFERLEGYAAWDRFEDLDYARRMGRIGRTLLLGPPILSSARRFPRGVRVWRRVAADFWLTCRYASGLGRGRLVHSLPGPRGDSASARPYAGAGAGP